MSQRNNGCRVAPSVPAPFVIQRRMAVRREPRGSLLLQAAATVPRSPFLGRCKRRIILDVRNYTVDTGEVATACSLRLDMFHSPAELSSLAVAMSCPLGENTAYTTAMRYDQVFRILSTEAENSG
jgi:hypothetical protein